MDDATIRFLIQKRIHVGEKRLPLEPEYKEKILELTKQMMEEPFTGSIQLAFETYMSELYVAFEKNRRTRKRRSTTKCARCVIVSGEKSNYDGKEEKYFSQVIVWRL